MGIRPVDDFDETFDSKLAGYDSINFSDFLFREKVFAFVQVLICLYIYIYIKHDRDIGNVIRSEFFVGVY